MRLSSLTITDFRSIGGSHEIPLNASVVLIHGGNGAGKTSLLSAIELGLTGSVGYMERLDQGFRSFLAHNRSPRSSVILNCDDAGVSTNALLMADDGWRGEPILDGEKAAEFAERGFLAQSQLGRLLELYQTVGTTKESALARFVRELLRLDEMDALIDGLEFTRDLRNTRRLVEGWSERERGVEQASADVRRLEQRLEDLKKQTSTARSRLVDLARATAAGPEEFNRVLAGIGTEHFRPGTGEEVQRARVPVFVGRVASLQRRIESLPSLPDEAQGRAPASERAAAAELRAWWQADGVKIVAALDLLREFVRDIPEPRVAGPLPSVVRALELLESEHERVLRLCERADAERVDRMRLEADLESIGKAREEVSARRAKLPKSNTSILASLSEIVSLLEDDICPVCGRDFSEISDHSLQQHVMDKLASDAKAAHLLVTIADELRELESRETATQYELAGVGDLDGERYESELKTLARHLRKVRRLVDSARRGQMLLEADAHASAALSRVLAGNEEWLVVEREIADIETASGITAHGSLVDRLDALYVHWSSEATRFESATPIVNEAVAANIQLVILQDDLTACDAELQAALAHQGRVIGDFSAAEKVRELAKSSRDALIAFRTEVVERVFSDSFNGLWRDMFGRLSPDEPFTPAFEVVAKTGTAPEVKLHTYGSDGEVSGPPGAMLSAGNLNTAALTLFLALHFSSRVKQPWLMLDDPVQSMDDVHISQLAALLGQIAYVEGRQVLLAVHDRNLFEYLRLELSPKTPDHSLITVELDRSASAQTRLRSSRIRWTDDQLTVSG